MSVALLDARSAAKYLSLSESTLNHWRMTGKGPAVCRIGRTIRYRVADLDQWIESCVDAKEKAAG